MQPIAQGRSDRSLSPSGPIYRALSALVGRRVRTAFVIVAAITSTLGLACSDNGSGPGTGTVRVRITGLGPEITTAGSAVITGPGISTITVQLPAAAVGDTTVPAGSYHVVYTPPQGYAIAAGTSDEADVTVSEGKTATVEFTVELQAGTLEIQVTGLDPGVSDGGTAEVVRTDAGAADTADVTIPASGVFDTTLAIGTYQVTYAPPVGYDVSPGATNPQDLTITDGQTSTATFQVQPEVPPDAVVFHSDWSTATGTGSDALTDAGKDKPWTIASNADGVMEVVSVASEGLDFPTTNVLKITADSGLANNNWGQPQFRTADNYVPVPNVGQSLYWRYYLRVTVPDAYTADPLTHGTQDGDNFGQRNFQHELVTATDGTFDLVLAVTNTPATNAWPDYKWHVTLNKDQTYRIEMQIARTGSTTFNLHARVYNVADSLLFSDENFVNENNSANLGQTPTLNFGDPGASALAALRTGLNGLGDGQAGVFPFVFGYWGAWAICTADWCGPYSGGI